MISDDDGDGKQLLWHDKKLWRAVTGINKPARSPSDATTANGMHLAVCASGVTE